VINIEDYKDIIEDIDMKKAAKLICIESKNIEHSNCGRCGSHNISFISQYNVSCAKCGNEFEARSSQDVYQSYAKKELKLLINYNDVLIYSPTRLEYVLSEMAFDLRKGTESGLINAEVYGPYSDVPAFNDKVICNTCGTCGNCLTCKNCSEKFVIKKDAECPKCHKTKFEPTKIETVVHKDGKSYCPYCGTSKVKHTSFFNKKKCPICGGEDLQGKKAVTNSLIIIRRFKGAKI